MDKEIFMDGTMSPQKPVTNILQLAIACRQAGDVPGAKAHYLAILQVDPQHPEANHNLGALLVLQQRAGEALPCFLAALEADSASGQYWISYIDALYQAGQLDDARQVFALAIRQGLEGEQVDVLAARLNGETQGLDRPSNREIDAVVALFGSGRLTEATGAAQALTLHYPGHEFGWKALGAIYKQMGDTEAALSPMQKAAALSPADVEAHYNLGVTLQDLGQFAEAEASYRHALLINPDYADAHANLGVVLQSLGRLNEAQASYRQALRIRPDFTAAQYNLGNVLKEQGHPDQAESCYRQLLLSHPDHAQVHCDLGNIMKERGLLLEAQSCYLKALQISPDNAHAHYNL
ncbi:MAG: tetratricopeptide repeat protein, partial [Gallionella sp.]